jgi:large conductance mechanosensitive channel
MGFIQEFKTFISKGNVMDLAIGVIIGAAFGKIVTSLVEDVFMPVIGKIIGGVDFTGLKYVISGAGTKEEVALRYGNFLQTSINFLIIAFCVFLMVKALNALKKKQEEAPAPPPEVPTDVKLLTEIRDLLAKK